MFAIHKVNYKDMSEVKLTLGQDRVGFNFNPSEHYQVKQYKTIYSQLIDDLEDTREGASKERNRVISRAQAHAEDACMQSVKALFKK